MKQSLIKNYIPAMSRFGPIAQMGCNHDNGPFWDKEPKTGCKFILQKGNF